MDLVIALTHTPVRMTKREIRSQVNGYAQAPSDQAFERMFERDKDLLRDLGIPVVTETDPVHEDEVGYRIDTEGYELAPVTLTAEEIAVLSLAAELWQDATLRPSARRALTKLRAVGARVDPAAHTGLALRVPGPQDAFGPLLEAVERRRRVAFTYRAASTGEVAARTVEPWRLLSRDRGWYLVGHDVDRHAPRVFRLSRIEGRVRPLGEEGAFTVPDDVDAGRLVDRAGTDGGLAVLAVLPERAAALRARVVAAPTDAAVPDVPGRDVLHVPYRDAEPFAGELAGYGDAVVVLAPAELREAVLRRLRAVAALGGAHG